ncbi:MAG TPA: lysylphosphatidylglycerol synthase transmembrane domain-containing protein [Candidatus Saccharimonadales bacterium]|nr:lysylphosphatidylglycerol synthase transmembrane domain-containing protein [Candidatus Saccharimonadales bacterium]
MGNSSFIQRRWKLLLNLVTIVALIILVYAVRHQLDVTIRNFSKVDILILLLIIPIEWVNYHAQAKLYQGLFTLVGSSLDYRFLFRAALELNFVNNIFPSGGVSGISYFGVRMRNKQLTGGRATLVHIMKLVLFFVSFELILIVGLLCLVLAGHISNFVVLIAASLSTILVIGTFAFVMIIGHERRIQATFAFLTRVLNRLVRLVLPRYPEAINIVRARTTVEELHRNYKMIESRYRDLKVPFVWALVANTSEIGAVYLVYIAFGHWVNPGAVILAYGIANFAGLVSVLPGGVGIYEALMTAVLAATGVRAALSLPVTIMYRVVNMLVQLPPGYVFYHRTLHRSENRAHD